MSKKDIGNRLNDSDEEVRRLAVIELGPPGGEDARKMLISALGDESWRVRKVAVEQILAFGSSDENIKDLLQCLHEEDNAGQRNAAAEALARIGQPAVEPLIKMLNDDDKDARKFAVDILGEIGDRQGLKGILTALEDEDENVRVAAAEALGRSGWQDAKDALLKALDREDTMLNATVLDALFHIEARVDADMMEPFLKDPILRRPALLALGGASDEKAFELLIQFLPDRRKGSREAAILSLDRLLSRYPEPERQSVIEKLKERASNKVLEGMESAVVTGDRETRTAAARLLGTIGRPESSPALLQAAADESIRREALKALRQIGEGVIPSLLDALPGLSLEEQVLTFEVLATLGDERTLPAMIDALNEPDDRLKEAAAEAIGALGDARGIEPLTGLLSSDEPNVSRVAINALISLAGMHPEKVRKAAIFAYENASSPAQRKSALDILAEVPAGGHDEIILSAVHDDNAMVRIAALKGIKSLHKSRASGKYYNALVAALTDENADVRASASDYLGELDDARAVRPLLSMLHDDNVLARVAAIKALGKIGDPSCSPALREMLKNTVGLVTVAAIEALSKVAPEDFLEEMDTFMEFDDPEVLKEVARALRTIPLKAAEDALVSLLDRTSWEVRSEAAGALADRGAAEKIPEIKARLEKEQDDFVRAVLHKAIARLHGEAKEI
ncbi:MAG: hypothetical protein GXP49_01790 [Deltaproteobacteria bacterium]|nr:hypothetical protein [Deltaproteobacteria bacterium]